MKKGAKINDPRNLIWKKGSVRREKEEKDSGSSNCGQTPGKLKPKEQGEWGNYGKDQKKTDQLHIPTSRSKKSARS